MPAPTFLGAGPIRGNSTFDPITITTADLPNNAYDGCAVWVVCSFYHRRRQTSPDSGGPIDSTDATEVRQTWAGSGSPSTAPVVLINRAESAFKTAGDRSDRIQDVYGIAVFGTRYPFSGPSGAAFPRTYQPWCTSSAPGSTPGAVTPSTAGGEAARFSVQVIATSYAYDNGVRAAYSGVPAAFPSTRSLGVTSPFPGGTGPVAWGITAGVMGSTPAPSWRGCTLAVFVNPARTSFTSQSVPPVPGPWVARYNSGASSHRGGLAVSEHPDLPYDVRYNVANNPSAGGSSSVVTGTAAWIGPDWAVSVGAETPLNPSPGGATLLEYGLAYQWTVAGFGGVGPPEPPPSVASDWGINRIAW